MLIFALFQFFPVSGSSEEKDTPALIVEFKEGTLSIQARETPLNRILDEIRRQCLLEISGLEDRRNELISFTYRGGIEEGLKHFLKHLGEKNFVFEFTDEQLKYVSVFPEAGDVFPPISGPDRDREVNKETFTAVKIHGIIEGSQAQAVGLQEGDLIIEYDGVKIRTPRQLIKEREKKKHRDRIELIVIRNNVIMPFVLKGGMIGVRIKTTSIPKDEFEYFHSGL